MLQTHCIYPNPTVSSIHMNGLLFTSFRKYHFLSYDVWRLLYSWSKRDGLIYIQSRPNVTVKFSWMMELTSPVIVCHELIALAIGRTAKEAHFEHWRVVHIRSSCTICTSCVSPSSSSSSSYVRVSNCRLQTIRQMRESKAESEYAKEIEIRTPTSRRGATERVCDEHLQSLFTRMFANWWY